MREGSESGGEGGGSCDVVLPCAQRGGVKDGCFRKVIGEGPRGKEGLNIGAPPLRTMSRRAKAPGNAADHCSTDVYQPPGFDVAWKGGGASTMRHCNNRCLVNK